MALSALLALSGCGAVHRVFGPSRSGTAAAAPASCPLAVILRPLANTAVFAPGATPRPENVAFYGVLDQVSSRCTAVPGAVQVRLTVDVIGQRGPAAKSDTVNLSYFVAVTAPGERVLQKQPLTVQVTIPPGKLRAGVTDRFTEVIPLQGYQPVNLTLDLGFQQSPTVIRFYRHFHGR